MSRIDRIIFNGISLFGSHTTAHKVSIERENFRAIQVSDLSKLSAEKVFEKLSLVRIL